MEKNELSCPKELKVFSKNYFTQNSKDPASH